MEKNSWRNFTQLLIKVWDIWASWSLFNIIVIICDIYFETFLYIFKVYRTLMHFLTFGTPQIITIMLNNLQLVYVFQLC